MSDKFTVGFDMDSILVDTFHGHLDFFNEKYGTKITPEQITRWNYENFAPDVGKAMGAVYKEPYFFYNLKPLDGAMFYSRAIADLPDTEVVIISSPTGSRSCMEKVDWVARYMPWFNPRSLILTHEKHRVKVDVLVDDSPGQIKSYRQAWPDSYIAGIKYPYNQQVTEANLMAENYYSSRRAWRTIFQAIQARKKELGK